MRTERFGASTLISLFNRRQVATMADMKAELGTAVDMTVFRKLRELDYLTSYSHRGRFYALRECARFDARGLWTQTGVHFSTFGSLLDTAEAFVNRSDRGFFATELTDELEVQSKDPLLKLVERERLAREVFSGLFLYCSRDPVRRKQQLLARHDPTDDSFFGPLRDRTAIVSDEAKAAIILFFGLLDEHQRRLYAGLESLRLGHGGDRHIADLIGIDVHTIAKGRRELIERDLKIGRVRRPGAGRKAAEKKRRS